MIFYIVIGVYVLGLSEPRTNNVPAGRPENGGLHHRPDQRSDADDDIHGPAGNRTVSKGVFTLDAPKPNQRACYISKFM